MEEPLAIEGLRAAAARELGRLRRAAGLGDHAVRGWRGWRRHTALALLAGEYLTSTVA